MLNPVASTILVIFFAITSLVLLGILGALLFALLKLNEKLEVMVGKVDPLLVKTDSILALTNEKISSIGDKTESILMQGEKMAENVHTKVDKTATTVQRAANAPLIGINSVMAGVTQGLNTFSRLQTRQTDAENNEIQVNTDNVLSTAHQEINQVGQYDTKIPVAVGIEKGN